MAEVVQLKTDGGLINPDDPMATARKFVKRYYTAPCELQTLVNHKETFLEYQGGQYHIRSKSNMRVALWRLLEKSRRAGDDSESGSSLIKPNTRMVNGILDALEAVTAIDDVDTPFWLLPPPDSRFIANQMLVLSNGILHIPTKSLISHTPAYLTLSSSSASFDATAPAPTQWLKFLDEVFTSDAEAIKTLQEFMGYCLTHDTRFQKIGFLHGPKRSGKGTIIRIMEHLLGASATASMTMASLSKDFGKQILLGKMLATFPDARFGSAKDANQIVESLLSISGEDSVNIGRKFTSDWSGRLHCKFLIASNDAPEFQDSSGSLLSRFVVICTKRSFLNSEDLYLEGKLVTELSGILNWALAGYSALYERSKFVLPTSSQPLIRTMEDSGSLVQAWLNRYAVLGQEEVAARSKVLNVWEHWCTEIRGMKSAPGAARLRIMLQSAVPGFDGDGGRPIIDGRRAYVYKGLRLKTAKELDADDA